MPYGPLSKSLGIGPRDSIMERCVTDLKAKGKDEASAIAICKASISKAISKRGA